MSWICCPRVRRIVFHASNVGGNWFSRGPRFLLEMSHYALAEKAKEMWFGLDYMLVPGVQQSIAWDLCWSLQQRSFNPKGHHCLNEWQKRWGGEKGSFLADPCIGIMFCQNPDIFAWVPSLRYLGLVVDLELGTIRNFHLCLKQKQWVVFTTMLPQFLHKVKMMCWRHSMTNTTWVVLHDLVRIILIKSASLLAPFVSNSPWSQLCFGDDDEIVGARSSTMTSLIINNKQQACVPSQILGQTTLLLVCHHFAKNNGKQKCLQPQHPG